MILEDMDQDGAMVDPHHYHGGGGRAGEMVSLMAARGLLATDDRVFGDAAKVCRFSNTFS